MKKETAFTMIELLVVVSIIGVIIGLSFFGLQSARQSSRDAKRKADLELIRTGIEVYKADCDVYPPTAEIVADGTLTGDNSTSSCSNLNTYLSKIPADPIVASNKYAYTLNGVTYTLCAALEQPPVPAVDVTGCGSCISTCNYKVTNP